jgi:hypothetical protein
MKHPTLFCPINLHAIDSSKRVLSAANDYLKAFPILFGYPASRAAALTWEPSIKQSTMANPIQQYRSRASYQVPESTTLMLHKPTR